MGWSLHRTASIADSEQETVLIITALDEDSDDEYMSAYKSPSAADSGRKRVLYAGLLLAMLVLYAVWLGAGHSPRAEQRLTQVGLLWCCAPPRAMPFSKHVCATTQRAGPVCSRRLPAPPPAAITWCGSAGVHADASHPRSQGSRRHAAGY